MRNATAAALAICRQARSHGLLADWRNAPDLGALLIGGADACDFLHRQLTSDVASLVPGQGQPTARLTRTGALVTAGSVHRLPDRGQPFAAFLLVADHEAIPRLRDDLNAHVVAEDVRLEDVTADFGGWVIQGPLAERVVGEVFGDSDSSALPGTLPPGWLALACSLTGDGGWLLLRQRRVRTATASTPDEHLHNLRSVATIAGLFDLDAAPAAAVAWDWLRIEAGRPAAGRDYVPGKTPLPQTGLEAHVVSTTKGCYLGQEVVARLRTYGSVPRALRGLVFADESIEVHPAFPDPGADLVTVDGETVGLWASSGLSVVWSAPVALALLDRTHRTPGTVLPVDVDGRRYTAQVVLLPLYQAADQREKAQSLHDRAVHLFSRGDNARPVALLEEALRLAPERRDSWEALGVILGRAGRYHEAIDIFRRLEEIAPDEPMVHTNLSLFYMKLGDREEAERQRALATSKRLGGATGAAAAAGHEATVADQRRRDARRKRDMFSEVLALDPADGLALMGLGNALVDLEDLEGAAEHLGRACSVLKDNSALYASLGKVQEQLGRSRDAAATYRRGVSVASRRGDLMPLREMEHRLLLLQPLAADGEA